MFLHFTAAAKLSLCRRMQSDSTKIQKSSNDSNGG
jgi:hypothetical protein